MGSTKHAMAPHNQLSSGNIDVATGRERDNGEGGQVEGGAARRLSGGMCGVTEYFYLDVADLGELPGGLVEGERIDPLR